MISYVLHVHCRKLGPEKHNPPVAFRVVVRFLSEEHMREEEETAFDGIAGLLVMDLTRRGEKGWYICDDTIMVEEAGKNEGINIDLTGNFIEEKALSTHSH